MAMFRFSLIVVWPMKSSRWRGRRLLSSGMSSVLGLPEIMRAISPHPLIQLPWLTGDMWIIKDPGIMMREVFVYQLFLILFLG
ncbi:MAG: hypothetical protein V3V23_04630 [Dehalococcoidales bacterium]